MSVQEQTDTCDLIGDLELLDGARDSLRRSGVAIADDDVIDERVLDSVVGVLATGELVAARAAVRQLSLLFEFTSSC